MVIISGITGKMSIGKLVCVVVGAAVVVFFAQVFIGFWRDPLGLPDDAITNWGS